jgi:hypothetical protein
MRYSTPMTHRVKHLANSSLHDKSPLFSSFNSRNIVSSASHLVPRPSSAFLYAMSCRMHISSTRLMGNDQLFGVRSGFSRRFNLVLGPQKLYLRKPRVLRWNSFAIADETAHDRIVKSGISGEQVNDASQVETSTSKHAIETTVEAAVTTGDAL